MPLKNFSVIAMFKVIWKDPVWSKVIATAILAGVALLGAYALNWWPMIAGYVTSVLAFAMSTTNIENWLIGLAIFLALPTVFLAVVVLWQLVSPLKPDAPNWLTYVSDEFFGLRWRWQYMGMVMSDMHTFCPHCDFQVYPSRASAFDAVNRIAFHCESCHRQLGQFDETYESLENKAQRFAQQKVRNGNWGNRGQAAASPNN